MNREHMVAGSEGEKRQDFTINNVQGQELINTEFQESQKSQRWWKRLLESGMGRKLISNGLWVLWDVTQPQGINLVGQHPNLVVHTSPNHQWHQGCADETKSVGVMKIIRTGDVP